MKKNLIFFSLSLIILSISKTTALTLEDAISQSTDILNKQMISHIAEDDIIKALHEIGITIYEKWNDFLPEKSIRRDEAAKMLTIANEYLKEYWNNKFTQKEKSEKECTFSDQKEAWQDLYSILVESCKQGLFKGSKGKFLPTSEITNGDIITVMGRILYGIQDESKGHYATNYANLLQKEGFLENLNIFEEKSWGKPAKRWTLAKLIFNVLTDKLQ